MFYCDGTDGRDGRRDAPMLAQKKKLPKWANRKWPTTLARPSPRAGKILYNFDISQKKNCQHILLASQFSLLALDILILLLFFKYYPQVHFDLQFIIDQGDDGTIIAASIISSLLLYLVTTLYPVFSYKKASPSNCH